MAQEDPLRSDVRQRLILWIQLTVISSLILTQNTYYNVLVITPRTTIISLKRILNVKIAVFDQL